MPNDVPAPSIPARFVMMCIGLWDGLKRLVDVRWGEPLDWAGFWENTSDAMRSGIALPGLDTLFKPFRDKPAEFPEVNELLDKIYLRPGVFGTVAGVLGLVSAKANVLKVYGAALGVALEKDLGRRLSPNEPSARELFRAGRIMPGSIKAGTDQEYDWTDRLAEEGFDDKFRLVVQALERTLLGVSHILELHRRGDLDDDAAVAEVKRLGYEQTDAERIVSLAWRWPDLDTLRQLYLRGEIDDDQLVKMAEGVGVGRPLLELIRPLWRRIPDPPDLIRMAVREAFDEEQARALGLDAAFPEAFKTWAAKQGVSEYWARMFWRAHWVLPSPQMGFEMLHRGVIDDAGLDGLLKALDYAPVWHDRLKRIAYARLTRVDIRRMYRVGLLSVDGVKQAYRDLGYSPEHVQLQAAFVIKEYTDEAKQLSRASAERAFRDGVIEADDLMEMYKDMGYSRTAALVMLASIRADVAGEQEKLEVEWIKARYAKRQLSETLAEAELFRLGLSARQVETYLLRWKPARTTTATETLPSRADLLLFLKANVFTTAEYDEEMRALGYSRKHVNWYLKAHGYEEIGNGGSADGSQPAQSPAP